MAGGVVAVQAAPTPEVDGSPFLNGPDTLGGRGCEHAEQPLQRPAIDPAGAVHQPARVSQVTGTLLMHHDLSRRVHRCDVPDAAGVVKVNMGDDHSGKIGRPNAKAGECVPHDRR